MPSMSRLVAMGKCRPVKAIPHCDLLRELCGRKPRADIGRTSSSSRRRPAVNSGELRLAAVGTLSPIEASSRSSVVRSGAAAFGVGVAGDHVSNQGLVKRATAFGEDRSAKAWTGGGSYHQPAYSHHFGARCHAGAGADDESKPGKRSGGGGRLDEKTRNERGGFCENAEAAFFLLTFSDWSDFIQGTPSTPIAIMSVKRNTKPPWNGQQAGDAA